MPRFEATVTIEATVHIFAGDRRSAEILAENLELVQSFPDQRPHAHIDLVLTKTPGRQGIKEIKEVARGSF